MSTLETLIDKLPPELQEVARRYASMLGANANKDDLLAIVGYVLKHQYQVSYEIMVRGLTNDELRAIHVDANVRIRELSLQTGSTITMQELITNDLIAILVRFGIAALTG